MNISYRILPFDVAVGELNTLKSGNFDIFENLEKEDFHTRPFTDFGISTERLLEVRNSFLKELGSKTGTLEDIKVRQNDKEFDSIFTRIAPTLFHDMNPIDGFNPDVWSYITLRLLPDLAVFRWNKNMTDERFLGGAHRSCFQRLWLRSYVLGSELACQLLEDEAVNIFERPESLGGNRRLAVIIAQYIVTNRGKVDSKWEEKIITTEIVRQAVMRLRRKMSVQVVQSMSDADLMKNIESYFVEAFQAKMTDKKIS
jgi:hypothetical protein